MEDFKEFAQPYIKVLQEKKARKLFTAVQKIQAEAGFYDLEDFEQVLELLTINNQLQLKERTWGAKFKDHLTQEQTTNNLMLAFINSELIEINRKDEVSDAHREAEKNFKESFDPNIRK